MNPKIVLDPLNIQESFYEKREKMNKKTKHKINLLLVLLIICGSGCTPKAISASANEFTCEGLNNGWIYSRCENKEVVCFIKEGALWCTKK